MEIFRFNKRVLKWCGILKPTPNIHWAALLLYNIVYHILMLTLFVPSWAFLLFGASPREVNDVASAIYIAGALLASVMSYFIIIPQRNQLVELLKHTQNVIRASKCSETAFGVICHVHVFTSLVMN